MKKINLAVPIIFAIFGLLVLGSSIAMLKVDLSSTVFPIATSLVLIVFSTVQIVQESRKGKGVVTQGDVDYGTALKTFTFVLGFVLAIKYISYLVVIPIFASALLYFVGKMNLRSIVTTVAVLELFSYIVFYRLLQVTIL